MSEILQQIDGTLKSLRIIHSALLVSMVLYVFAAEFLAPPVQQVDHALLISIAVVAVVMAFTAFLLRIKMIRPALDTLQLRPTDIPSLNRWRAGSFISDALVEGIVLFGSALRMLGASLPQAAWFYVAGPLLMLLWWPRRP